MSLLPRTLLLACLLAGAARLGLALQPALAASPEEEARSSVSILVDLSQTWHNERDLKQNQLVLAAVTEAAVQLGALFTPPTHIRVLPIGDASLLRPPLCEAIFDPKLISSSSGNGSVFTQERALRRYIKDDCITFVLSRSREDFTDISGAIDSAARMAALQPGTERAIVILSDMLEDLPAGQIPSDLALQGYRILIVYRALETDRKQPALLNERLSDWKARLSNAGAEVEVVADQGITAALVVRLLRD